MDRNPSESAPRRNRTICLPFRQEAYGETVADALRFGQYADEMFSPHPELFPPETAHGWQMKDIFMSEKQDIMIRRMEISGIAHTVRPSFVMPYMTGMTDDSGRDCSFADSPSRSGELPTFSAGILCTGNVWNSPSDGTAFLCGTRYPGTGSHYQFRSPESSYCENVRRTEESCGTA